MLLLTWSGRKLKFDKFLSTTWEKQIEDRVFHGYDIHNYFLSFLSLLCVQARGPIFASNILK